MLKKQLVFEVLAKLEKYFGKILDAEIRNMYVERLQDLYEKEFKAASVRMITEFEPTATKPFPLIKDFLTMCGKDAKTQSINIVTAVKKAAEALGQYASVDFNDPALHSVIRRYGGWPEIVFWGEKDWQFHERNFIAAYEAAQRAGLKSGYCKGVHEIENTGNNYPHESPHIVCSKTGNILKAPLKSIAVLVIEQHKEKFTGNSTKQIGGIKRLTLKKRLKT